MTYPIPDAALDDRLAVVGTAGAGKTYAAMTAVERLLDRGARVITFDPLGVWYGLRLTADGKATAYPMAVIGGPHGDLPITEHSGAIVGETIARAKESILVDLSQLGTKAAERRFMLAVLTSLYRQASGEPVHLVFDEADMWAPQKLMDKEGDAAKLLGQMETIVRRGRVKGFVPWLITQRPAVLSKDVLSQADGLIAMKLVSSQDRGALGAWIEGQADVQQGKAILASMPQMQRGQGIVWIPARGVLETVQFPAKKTFDSSRTPKRGEHRTEVVLRPLDIEALRGRLATVETEVQANDPKRLKAEIARLSKLAAEPQQIITQVKGHTDEEMQAEFERGFAEGIKSEANRLGKLVLTFSADFAIETQRPVEDMTPAPKSTAPPILHKAAKPAHNVANSGSMTAARTVIASDASIGAERKPLAALVAIYPGGLTEAQWAQIAGFKRTGGTWGTYKSRLRSRDLIQEVGDLWYATPQGVDAVGEDVPQMPEPGPELVDFWCGKIGAESKFLRRLAVVYPNYVTKDGLAEFFDMTPSGGTFGTYLSRLRSNGLIETNGSSLRAAPTLMERA